MEVLITSIVSGLGAGIGAVSATAGFIAFGVTAVLGGLSWLMNRQDNNTLAETSQMVRSTTYPKEYVYGSVWKSGLIVYAGTPAQENNVYAERGNLLYIVLALAAHEVDRIGMIKFNDEFCTSDKYADPNHLGVVPAWESNYTDDGGYAQWDVVSDVEPDFGETVTYQKFTEGYLSGSTTHPYDDVENWQEIGRWYTIRRYNGSSSQTADPRLMLEPPTQAELNAMGGAPTARFTYREDGLGYVGGAEAGGLVWDSSMRLRGIAYVVIKLRGGEKFYGRWESGIPNIKAFVRGKKVYDPGESNYVFSRNPVLCIADYMSSEFGLQIAGLDQGASAEIDWDVSEDEADYCNEEILHAHYGMNEFTASVTATYLKDWDLVSTSSKDWTPFAPVSGAAVARVRLVMTNGNAYVAYLGSSGDPGDGSTVVYVWQEASMENAGWTEEDESTEGVAGDAYVGAPSGTIDHYAIIDDDCYSARYTLDGVVNSADKPLDVVTNMCTAMAGNAVWINGKYRLYAGRYRTPTAKITLDDVISSLSIQPKIDRKTIFNTVQGTYGDRATGQSQDFAKVFDSTALAADDGKTLTQNLDFPFSTHISMVERLARIYINKNRLEKAISFVGHYSLFPLTTWQNVDVDFTYYADGSGSQITSGVFQITAWRLRPPAESGEVGVELSLMEEAESAYEVTYEDVSSLPFAEASYPINDDDLAVPTITTVSAGVLVTQTTNKVKAKYRAKISFSLSDDRAKGVGAYIEADLQPSGGSVPVIANYLVSEEDTAPYSAYDYGTTGGLSYFEKTEGDFSAYIASNTDTYITRKKIRVINEDGSASIAFLGNLISDHTGATDVTKILVYKDPDLSLPGWQIDNSAQTPVSFIVHRNMAVYEETTRTTLSKSGGAGTLNYVEVDLEGEMIYPYRSYLAHVRAFDQYRRFGDYSSYYNFSLDYILGQYTPDPVSNFQAFNLDPYGGDYEELVLLKWKNPPNWRNLQGLLIRKGADWDTGTDEVDIAISTGTNINACTHTMAGTYVEGVCTDTFMIRTYDIIDETTYYSEIVYALLVEDLQDGDMFYDSETGRIVSLSLQMTFDSNYQYLLTDQNALLQKTIIATGGTNVLDVESSIERVLFLFVDGSLVYERGTETEENDSWSYEVTDYDLGYITPRGEMWIPQGATCLIVYTRGPLSAV